MKKSNKNRKMKRKKNSKAHRMHSIQRSNYLFNFRQRSFMCVCNDELNELIRVKTHKTTKKIF